MKKYIKVASQFGHEIMALNFAKALGLKVVILPKKETEEEFTEESAQIYSNLSFFDVELLTVDFNERETYEAEAWDIIGDLRAGKLDKALWSKFAESQLTPQYTKTLPKYRGLRRKNCVLVIPQKLVSDGGCGVTAKQQSLPLEAFHFFLKNREIYPVLGQHFHKENDLADVKRLAEEYQIYVPGLGEYGHVLGIRGVNHEEFYHMYDSLEASVGIAGTHTWLLLTMFPETPQIILYNKGTVEDWKALEAAYQELGYPIYCIGYDEETDMHELTKQIESEYTQFCFRY